MTITSVNQPDDTPMIRPANIRMSLASLLIAGLVGFVLITRLLMLGAPAMTENEIIPALAAWRSVAPSMAGSELLADSSMTYVLQRISIEVFGASEFAARLPIALGGIAVVLSIGLFRDVLGRGRAFVLMGMLASSPVLLAASRFSSPVIWSVLFALLGLWAISRFWQTQQGGYAIVASVMTAGLIFLSEPAGNVFFLILLGSVVAALMLSSLDAPLNDDLPADAFLANIRQRFNTWPISLSVGVSLLVVFCITTGFFTNPSGLSVIGETLQQFFAGWQQRPAGAPLFYPMSTAFFYETFLFVFAGIAVIVMNATGRITFIERFLMAWVLLGLVACLIYPSAIAPHALWLTLPLAGLTSQLITQMFERIKPDEWWPVAPDGIGWTKAVLVIIAFALFMMSAMHFQIAVRGFWLVSGNIETYASFLQDPGFNAHTISLIAFLICTLSIVIGYFLATSFVGMQMPTQAFTLGAFLFVMLTSFGSGWNLISNRSNDSAELWFINGTSDKTHILRRTLMELSVRQTQGVPLLPVVAVTPDDGIIGWILRDFPNAKFVESVEEAAQAQIIIMPSYQLLEGFDLPYRPNLQVGAIYVGQDFETLHTWRSSWLDGFQSLAWWSARLDTGLIDARYRPQPLERVVLWVRQDVYNGQLFDPTQP